MSETLEPALPNAVDRMAEQRMRELCDRDLRVATAESCTGGLLASLLTDIQGCGHGFERGFVTYTEDAKSELLGIDRKLIGRCSAVSRPVAEAMAAGALARSSADIALSVTGYAGPGTNGEEEGLVHFAMALRKGAPAHREEHFGAIGRGPVRIAALGVLLEMLGEAIRAHPAPERARSSSSNG